MEERWNMSKKEIDRYEIIQRVINKQIKQLKAAELLKITPRHLRRLQRLVEMKGPQGVISRSRGKPGNQRKSPLKQKVFALIQERFEGWGPTLIAEKLESWHEIKLSWETIRLWMIEAHLWIPKESRKKTHLSRPRRDCFGELVQYDGSIHHWFGPDLPIVTAIVGVDDATSTLTSLVFAEGETTIAYFSALKQHIEEYGIPRSLYTDKDSVFKLAKGSGVTQFQRALQELDVELIYAHSPQAKGRVERKNRLLQDRLVKEMIARGINTIEAANKFAKEYVKEHNKKFSKKPKSSVNAHRSLEGYDLERILAIRETRTVLADCTFQYNNCVFVIQNISEPRRLKGMKVEIIVNPQGKIRVFLKDREVEAKLLQECEMPAECTRKEMIWREKRAYRSQPSSHPWKRAAAVALIERAYKAKQLTL
jgi:hypothetical protein